jgi:hypothetical protein
MKVYRHIVDRKTADGWEPVDILYAKSYTHAVATLEWRIRTYMTDLSQFRVRSHADSRGVPFKRVLDV